MGFNINKILTAHGGTVTSANRGNILDDVLGALGTHDSTAASTVAGLRGDTGASISDTMVQRVLRSEGFAKSANLSHQVNTTPFQFRNDPNRDRRLLGGSERNRFFDGSENITSENFPKPPPPMKSTPESRAFVRSMQRQDIMHKSRDRSVEGAMEVRRTGHMEVKSQPKGELVPKIPTVMVEEDMAGALVPKKMDTPVLKSVDMPTTTNSSTQNVVNNSTQNVATEAFEAGFFNNLSHGAGTYAASMGLGVGTTYMAEGDVSLSGTLRGAMFGLGGGIAGRAAMGSLQKGGLNNMLSGAGTGLTKLAGEADGVMGTSARTAGDFLSSSMNSLATATGDQRGALRAAAFAGAGLAGFSMGRDRSHSRGMNGGRGNRF